MNISIKSKNIDLTNALKDYTEKRVNGLAKFTGEHVTAVVEIGKTTTHHKQGDIFSAEINLTTMQGKQFRAASQKSDLYGAIDDMRDEIVREVSSSKGKTKALWKRGAQRIKNILRGFRS